MRGSKTIDVCYGNIRNAYQAIKKPPVGGSDHNTVYLLSSYHQRLKKEKPKVRSVPVWDPESLTALQGCFDCMDWEIFECENFDNHMETVTAYINICVDNMIHTKRVKMFANSKP